VISLNLTPEQRLKLMSLAGIQNGDLFRFLGFSLNLQTGEFIDDLQKSVANPEVSNPTMYHQITELLVEYSGAAKKPLSGKQVKFRVGWRMRTRLCVKLLIRLLKPSPVAPIY
jgi:hypothetical protein